MHLPLHCFKPKQFGHCCMIANLALLSQLPKWQMNTSIHEVTLRNKKFWQEDNKVTPMFPFWNCFTASIKKNLTAYVSCTYSVHTLAFLYFSKILTTVMTGSIHHSVASFSFSFYFVSSLFWIYWRLDSNFHLYACDFSFFFFLTL